MRNQCPAMAACDISEKTTAEDALELSRRLLRGEEAERKRISQDLHDSVNQLLASLKFCLESLMRRLPKGDRAAYDLAQEATTTLETTMCEVRRICRNLRPAVLDDLGFLAATRSICEELRKRTGLCIQMSVSDFPERLAPEIETALLRITQEALNNAVQHSRAKEVVVSLSCSDRRVKAVITDDGRGFCPNSSSVECTREGHCGLINIRERAALAGGTSAITSTPDRGVRIEVELPVDSPGVKEDAPVS